MDLLLVLTYAAFCIAIFKIFKIPLNKWSVPTAVLGGVVLIGTLIFTMNYNHPFSEISRTYFVTTPIVPNVKGEVIEVPVKGNQRVQKNDVLFRIDPTPFQNSVDALQAQLTSAKLDQVRAQELIKRQAGRQRDLDLANAQVSNIEAQLATAQYQLDETVVRAPANGYATQVALRPGMVAVNIPLRPAMTFVQEESHYLTGWYRQNSMMRLEVGNDAEIAFDGIPGTVFAGKVAMVSPVLAEGQIQASSNLVSGRQANYPGRIPIFIEITDPRFKDYAASVPGGAYAQTAVYSEHFHHVAIMRKILLRMASWMNYLFPFH
ncbi:MAG: HlyD family secretion protein [Cellvibrionaceae bacterium]